jgi:hypothetical protein
LNAKRAKKPTASATAIVAKGTPMTAAGVHPGRVRSIAQMTEEQPITEPTERSMPPSRMTMVIPVATRPVIDTCRSTSVRFKYERKMFLPPDVWGEASAPIRQMSAKPQ